MKKEYDFSKGERGKFYNADAEFNFPMLKESEVIEAVCIFLENKGWNIKSRCNETEKGNDIVAINQNRNLVAIIEAKGATSSKEYTARFGKQFSTTQIKNHVANAFFRIASNIDSNYINGMALPATQKHKSYVRKIEVALRKLQLEVFWVSSDGSVKPEGFSLINY